MALVQSNGNQQLRRANRNSLGSYLLPAVAGLLSRATDSASKQVVNNLMQQASSGSGNRGQNGGGNSRNVGGGGRRRRRKRGGGGQNSVTPANPLSSFRIAGTNSRTITATMRGTQTAVNTSASNVNSTWYVGYSGNAGTFMLSWLPQSDVKLLQAFTYAKIHRITMRYTGAVGANAAGYLAIGFTDNTGATTNPGLSDVTGARVSSVASMNGAAYIDVPINAPAIFLNDTSQDVMHRAVGCIHFNSSNASAISAVVALTEFTVTLTMY